MAATADFRPLARGSRIPHCGRMNEIPNRQAPAELASKQHGVLSYQQLKGLGVKKSFIASRCASGEWIAQSRTIWVVAGSPETIHDSCGSRC